MAALRQPVVKHSRERKRGGGWRQQAERMEHADDVPWIAWNVNCKLSIVIWRFIYPDQI